MDKQYSDLISVIVPIYNVEMYLKRCIDSILQQSYTNFELILIDDGSIDNCPKICDQYALQDNRIKVIHKKNGGLSDARNRGLNLAEGKYVTFIDSDDKVSRYFLEYLYLAISNNDCEIAICDFINFSSENEINYDVVYNNGNTYSPEEMLWKIYSNCHHEYIESTVAWNKMYKKELFDDISFPIGKIHEDEATTYKLYWKAKKIVKIPCKLYFYFYNKDGIMNKKFNSNRLDYLEALNDRYDFYNYLDKKELADYTAKLLYIYIVDYGSLSYEKLSNYYEFRKKLIEHYKRYRLKLLLSNISVKCKFRIVLSYLHFDFLVRTIHKRGQ